MNNVDTIDTVIKRAPRRKHSAEFRTNVLRACSQLGASVAIDTALVRVINVLGAAHPHQAYLFANRRANRMRVLVHDGIGIWPIELELQTLAPTLPADAAPRQQPKRAALPPELPRIDQHHEPDSTTCATAGCGYTFKRIGEDISEKLDYTPGLFTVERHIRGKWACVQYQSLIQAPVPAQIIDKGIATAGLLVRVLVAKYADHLPLYHQEGIFARAGW